MESLLSYNSIAISNKQDEQSSSKTGKELIQINGVGPGNKLKS